MIFSTMPSLEQFRKQVTIIESVEHKKNFKKDSTFLLGVDVGSTTTKAVLVDPEDLEVIASFYGRTSGNPVEATRKCINEIISQVGNQKVNLVGVTGSGREIVGAYLGTSAVYNEISAHSRGAVFYDPEVDTVFESPVDCLLELVVSGLGVPGAGRYAAFGKVLDQPVCVFAAVGYDIGQSDQAGFVGLFEQFDIGI